MPTDDPESAAIIEGWQEYQRVYEKFASNPNGSTDYTETQHVTTGHESTVILDRIDGYRDNNLESAGGLAFRDIEVSAPQGEGDGTATVELSYCLDLNEFRVRDTVSGEIIQRSGTFAEVAFMRKGLDEVWRVEGLTAEEAEC